MLMYKKPNTPLTVYLDQNKWIDLSRAYHQQPSGVPFAQTFLKVQNAVKQKTARFPFSSVHVLETMKMGDRSRRQRLAQVMTNFSEGWAIAPWGKVNPVEFSMSVPKAFNKPFPITSPVVFGLGIEFAFGEPKHTNSFADSLDNPIEMKRKVALQFLAIILSSPDESLRKPGIDKYNTSMKSIADQADKEQ